MALLARTVSPGELKLFLKWRMIGCMATLPPFWQCWVKRVLRALLIGVAVAYLLLALTGAFCANRLIFVNGPSSYRDDGGIIKLTTADGNKISARYLPNPAAKYTILFSHGNGEDIGQCANFMHLLHKLGFAVCCYDYHGTAPARERRQKGPSIMTCWPRTII